MTGIGGGTGGFAFDPRNLPTGEEIRRYQAQQQERLAQIVARGEAARAELAATEIKASARDGSVTVVVGAGGVLKDLTFGPKAKELTTVQLRAAILASYRGACKAAAERSAAAVARIGGGTDDPSFQMMRDAVPTFPDDDLDEPGDVR